MNKTEIHNAEDMKGFTDINYVFNKEDYHYEYQ